MSYRVSLLVAFALVLGFAGTVRAESVTVTKAVQDACAWEYDKFCTQYGLGSALLDMCFKQNARNMTKACVEALVAAGDVSQEYVDQQKRLLSRRFVAPTKAGVHSAGNGVTNFVAARNPICGPSH